MEFMKSLQCSWPKEMIDGGAIYKTNGFGSSQELTKERRGGEQVETTNIAHSLRIFAVNEATDGLIFSRSELFRCV